jgi:hypothetical protein
MLGAIRAASSRTVGRHGGRGALALSTWLKRVGLGEFEDGTSHVKKDAAQTDANKNDGASDDDDSTKAADPATAWTNQRMPDDQFAFMRKVLAAPSPVGMEAAMTRGVLEERFHELKAAHGLTAWRLRTFKGNSGVVWETSPPLTTKTSPATESGAKKLTVMVCGHADKIRLQVRNIDKDGKVWVNTDSFLPITLVGNECRIFSVTPESADSATPRYHSIDATAEALGAIHFAPPAVRDGREGLKSSEIYLELGLHGKDRQKQVQALGIRVGDPVLLNRPIKRCVGPNTFSGAYLDNGLGCFVAAELARLVAERNPVGGWWGGLGGGDGAAGTYPDRAGGGGYCRGGECHACALQHVSNTTLRS